MSGFSNLFQYLANAVGISVEALFMMVLLLPCILFFSADFKLGLISTLLVMSGTFIWFYQFGFQTDVIIILILLCIVVLAFTLYFISSKVERGFV